MPDPRLDADAAQILRTNDRGRYTVPTAGLYPFQWNWDSCLVALGWAAVDEDRAFAEIETLFAHQWPDGMMPHIVFHKADPGYFPGPDVWGTDGDPATSGITQPPVAAICLRWLSERAGDRARAAEATAALVGKLDAWHRWWRRARDPQGTGLVAVLHPWETGMDNSPAWDAALARVPADDVPPYQRRDTGHVDADQRPRQFEYDRYLALVHLFREAGWDPDRLHDLSPFRVVDVGINGLLLRAERDLVHLAREAGREDIAAAAGDRANAIDAALDHLWDEASGLYKSWDRVADAFVPTATSAGFLPLAGGNLPARRREALLATLDGWLDAAPYGLPTVHPNDPAFDAKRYWRGPSWAIVDFLVMLGLTQTGEVARADRLAAMAAGKIRTGGFWEYFHPLTGQGLGGHDFSWTAAMWLAWLTHVPPVEELPDRV